MKKLLVCMLIICLIFGAVACGSDQGTVDAQEPSSESPTESNASGADDTDKIVVSFASQWFSEEGRAEILMKAAETFEEENPEYVFEAVPIAYSDFNDKMKVSFSSGEAPTLVYCIGDWFEAWYEQGWLAPLDDYVEINSRQEEFAVWNAQEAAQRNGQNYGLNIETCPYGGLIFNMELLDEAGITEIPDTPEGFLDMLQTLTHDDQYGTIAANTPDNLAYILQAGLPYIMGFGGVIADEDGNFLVDSPEFVEGVEYYREIATTCAPTAMQYSTQRQLFFDGKVACVADGGYFVTWAESTNPDLAGKLDVTYLPLPSKANNTDIVYVCLSATASEEEKIGAGKFLEILMRDEFQQDWLSGCNYPVTMKSGITDEYRAENSWVTVYEDLAANGVSGEVPGHETSTDEIRKIVVDYIMRAIEDPSSDVQELMTECREKLEEV